MSRRAAVLEALRAAGERGVSGEALAHDLGVSRVAVAKHVSALRALGYRIGALAGSGYRLLTVPDAPLPAEVAPLLRSQRWTRLEGGGPTGSTNDDAKRLARADAADGTVVLASAQATGRGRLGRSWTSPVGGVYLSAVLRPDLAVAAVPPLALVVGLGVAEGLERLGVHALLKWPNDLVLDGGKLAGVLLEMSAEADLVEWVVAGIGINVRRPEAGVGVDAVHADGSTPAIGVAYVDDVAPGQPLARVAAAVLDGIAEALGAFDAGGFAALKDRYSVRDALNAGQVTVSDLTGRVLARGEAAGVDEAGRLLVREEDGRTAAVSSGEVTLRVPGGE